LISLPALSSPRVQNMPVREKRPHFIAYFFIVFVIMLDGCATTNTTKNIPGNYMLDEEKGTGVVIVSLTHSGFQPSLSVAFRLRDANDKNRFDEEVLVNDHSSSELGCSYFETSAGRNTCGRRLAIIELPQGEYEFYSWHAASSSIFSKRSILPETQFSKRFRITPGKAVYIGNLWLFYDQGQYRIEVIDMRQRDLQLLYRRHENIYPDNIIINIPQ
jgi:hypothetical protein